jgi:hypothetical protein
MTTTLTRNGAKKTTVEPKPLDDWPDSVRRFASGLIGAERRLASLRRDHASRQRDVEDLAGKLAALEEPRTTIEQQARALLHGVPPAPPAPPVDAANRLPDGDAGGKVSFYHGGRWIPEDEYRRRLDKDPAHVRECLTRARHDTEVLAEAVKVQEQEVERHRERLPTSFRAAFESTWQISKARVVNDAGHAITSITEMTQLAEDLESTGLVQDLDLVGVELLPVLQEFAKKMRAFGYRV